MLGAFISHSSSQPRSTSRFPIRSLRVALFLYRTGSYDTIPAINTKTICYGVAADRSAVNLFSPWTTCVVSGLVCVLRYTRGIFFGSGIIEGVMRMRLVFSVTVFSFGSTGSSGCTVITYSPTGTSGKRNSPVALSGAVRNQPFAGFWNTTFPSPTGSPWKSIVPSTFPVGGLFGLHRVNNSIAARTNPRAEMHLQDCGLLAALLLLLHLAVRRPFPGCAVMVSTRTGYM